MFTRTTTTLLTLVQTVSQFAISDAEVVATVAYLVNSGKVRLCGNFAGATIDLTTPTPRNTVWTRRAMKSLQKSAQPLAQ